MQSQLQSVVQSTLTHDFQARDQLLKPPPEGRRLLVEHARHSKDRSHRSQGYSSGVWHGTPEVTSQQAVLVATILERRSKSRRQPQQ